MSGWVERSKTRPDGQVVHWRERPKPGHPGVVEQRFTQPAVETRVQGAGSVQVAYSDEEMHAFRAASRSRSRSKPAWRL